MRKDGCQLQGRFHTGSLRPRWAPVLPRLAQPASGWMPLRWGEQPAVAGSFHNVRLLLDCIDHHRSYIVILQMNRNSRSNPISWVTNPAQDHKSRICFREWSIKICAVVVFEIGDAFWMPFGRSELRHVPHPKMAAVIDRHRSPREKRMPSASCPFTASDINMINMYRW